MSKRAEIAQASAILPESIISYAKEHAVLSGLVYREGVKFGYERAEKDIIDCTCKWLFSHLPILVDCYNEDIHEKADRSEFIKLFRTQMEEQ